MSLSLDFSYPDPPVLINDTFIRAAKGLFVDYTPVWFMRQAGRIQPLYKNHIESNQGKFALTLRNVDLVSKFTIEPIHTLDVDAAVIFSDILVILWAMDFKFNIKNIESHQEPYYLEHIDQIEQRLLTWTSSDVTLKLKYCYDGVSRTVQDLKGSVPLIGIAGAPFTLMCFMIDGCGLSGNENNPFPKTREWIKNHKDAVEKILFCLVEHICNHIIHQIKAGAQAIQIFDSYAYVLANEIYRSMIVPYFNIISNYIKEHYPDIPLILYTSHDVNNIDVLSTTGFNVLSLSQNVNPTQAYNDTKSRITFQGNMDPKIVYESLESIEMETKQMLSKYDLINGYIANLGHGCEPTHELVKLKKIVDTVHHESARLIKNYNLINNHI